MIMSADFKSLLVRDEESASAVQFDLSTAAVADAWGLWVSEGGSLYLFDGSRFVGQQDYVEVPSLVFNSMFPFLQQSSEDYQGSVEVIISQLALPKTSLDREGQHRIRSFVPCLSSGTVGLSEIDRYPLEMGQSMA